MRLMVRLLLLFACCSLAVSAQQVDSFISKHDQQRAQNPEGLLFTVRLKDNRKQFHLGEIITLELSFAASKPETFILDAATYDRSGRLHSDDFVVDPGEGVVDPLTDYFDAQLHAFSAGGLRGIPDLRDKPYLITAELNEWKRIDQPGHYRLYVVSSRLGKKGSIANVFSGNQLGPVVSDVIEFDVLPADKKWATQKLSEAISALSKPEEVHRSGCRTLRFLGTKAAATEMRKRFSGEDPICEWDYKFGLIGSPHRDFVIRDMENSISLREQPITSHYIRTLALLEFSKLKPEIPPNPGEGDEEQTKQWRAQLDRRQRIYDDLCLNYARQLAMVTQLKQGQARVISLETLLDFLPGPER